MGTPRGRWVQVDGDGHKKRAIGTGRWRWVQKEEGDGYKKRAMGTSSDFRVHFCIISATNSLKDVVVDVNMAK